MEHQCDFKIESSFDSREVAQISGLISDLDRILRIIDLDITAQEEDARTRAVAVVPYDPALEVGSSIEYGDLQTETRHAWLRATSTMVEPFVD